MRRDRAVVDDPPAARILRLHDLKGFLRAQEDAGQVNIHDRLPFLEGNILERRWRTDAGIVEQEVEAAERVLDLRKQRSHRGWISDVGGNSKGFCTQTGELGPGLVERCAAPARQYHGPSIPGERHRCGLPDASSRACHERNLVYSDHL